MSLRLLSPCSSRTQQQRSVIAVMEDDRCYWSSAVLGDRSDDSVVTSCLRLVRSHSLSQVVPRDTFASDAELETQATALPRLVEQQDESTAQCDLSLPHSDYCTVQ